MCMTQRAAARVSVALVASGILGGLALVACGELSAAVPVSGGDTAVPLGGGAEGGARDAGADGATGAAPDAPDAERVERHTRLLVGETPPPGRTGASSISSVRSDGSGKILLTEDGAMPSWTPDGAVIFVSSRSGAPQIWTMDDHGNDAKQLGGLPPNLSPFMPQLAKNGQVVFMASDPTSPAPADGNVGIWTMQRDGSGLRQVISGQQPFLAPSGTWIAYSVQTETPYHREIWRIDIDGNNARALTSLGDPDYPDANAPSISPDGSMVAFFSGKESDEGPAGLTQSVFTFGHRNVAVVPAAGGPRRTLTPCQPVTTEPELLAATRATGRCIAADNPAWSPDGAWLIFDTGFSDGTETWMVAASGDGFQRFYAESRGIVRVALKSEDGT
jgi:hypothetical protein